MMTAYRVWRPVLVALVLLLAVAGGGAVAQDIITTDGPLTTGMDRLYRDFGDYQTEMVSLAPYDSVSGAPYFLDVAHYEIHAGGMYHAEYSVDTVADDASIDVLLAVSDTTYAHAIFEVAVGGQSSVVLYESPTVTSTGTVIPSYNMNRPITATAASGIYHTPTLAVSSKKLVDRIIPAGATAQTRVGGQSSKGVEWVLTPGENYLLRITNTSGGAIPVSVMFEWYEGTYTTP